VENLDVFHKVISPLSKEKREQLREILHDLEDNANKFYLKNQIISPPPQAGQCKSKYQ